MGINEHTWKVISAIPYLLKGVGMTLKITFLALIFGAFFGLLLALARVYGGSISRRFAIVYSRIIRSLPLLVILFMLYYLASEILDLSPFLAVVLALAVHTSAYQSEIFRGSIQSISKGQMEAALALGMSKFQCVLYIILPQALRRALPYWSNEAAIVLKDSALAYVLGIAELMRRGEYVVARSSQSALLTYLIIGIIYFILTSVLTRSLLYAEKKLRIPC
ncbi:MAG: polar amino acid transport system permease protein [Thermosediminibacterales bacterium]|nr:polar amino acid transport system permease protein [Thermosediminibacterales bacterium]